MKSGMLVTPLMLTYEWVVGGGFVVSAGAADCGGGC